MIHDDLGDGCSSSSKYFDERRNSLKHASIIHRFQSDNNWSNPKAVDLMCKSYGIDNINQYDSLITSSSSMDGNNRGDVSTRNNNKWTYLTIKLEQNHMFASNLYAEGVVLMNTMKYDEAVKKFTDAIHYNDKFVDAYIERAHAYELLSMPQVALEDYSKVKEIRTMSITDNGSRFDKMTSSSTNKLTNNADLITKLQYSIYKDTTSAGNQKHSQSIGSMVHTSGGGGGWSQASVKANILSPDGSSTADSDSSYDEVNCATGSLRHNGDDDELINSKKKQKRKRDKHKKSKKKKHKKHKKSSD